jgi:3-phenylpropionate/cinnamic acid dioxygenase small subunit
MSATGGADAPWSVELEQVVWHHRALRWLEHEAELLDAHRYRDWLGLLDPSIRYVVPTTVTLDRKGVAGGRPPLGGMAHLDEDLYSLEKRVERLEGSHAWTEDPPSRTRRFVTNVRAEHLLTGDPQRDEVAVRSNLLLYRSRGDDREAELVSCERTDLLRSEHGHRWLLVRRSVVLDDAVVRTQNLALPL